MRISRAITLSLLVIPLTAWSVEMAGVSHRKATFEPMGERRVALAVVDSAVIGVQRSDNFARCVLAIRSAKLDAYSRLTEQLFGRYFDAFSTEADLAVSSARIEGVVHGAKLVRMETKDVDSYEAKMSVDKDTVRASQVMHCKKSFEDFSSTTGD